MKQRKEEFLRAKASDRNGVLITKQDVVRFKASFKVGDRISFIAKERINLVDDTARDFATRGEIVEIYPHICRIKYRRKGADRMAIRRWVDLAIENILRGYSE